MKPAAKPGMKPGMQTGMKTMMMLVTSSPSRSRNPQLPPRLLPGGASRFARKWRCWSAWILCGWILTASMPAQDGAGDGRKPFTLCGGKVLLPDGTLASGLAVVIRGDRIERVSREDEAGLPDPVRLPPDAVLSPGLIDAGSSLGAFGQNRETARPVDLLARASLAVDPHHPDLRVALEAGITAAMVCPEPENVVSGRAVVFRTAPFAKRLDILRDDGPLTFALGSSVFQREREPTSRGGARHLLREALAHARAPEGAGEAAGGAVKVIAKESPAESSKEGPGGGTKEGRTDGHRLLRAFLEGKIPGIVFCEAPEDVRTAFEIFKEFGRVPDFAYTSSAPLGSSMDFARQAAAAGVSVISGPLGFRAGEETLKAPGLIAKAGVRVAFRGALPAASRHSLRLTAALAARHGMEPAAARRALTAAAAEVCGVPDRVGSIAAGKDADLVIFSGDPLRLDSRVLEVYIRGSRAFQARAGGDGRR
jgi:imidazolonepropionase-like amidohydrolase